LAEAFIIVLQFSQSNFWKFWSSWFSWWCVKGQAGLTLRNVWNYLPSSRMLHTVYLNVHVSFFCYHN